MGHRYICYLPAGRSVWSKNVTEVLKIFMFFDSDFYRVIIDLFNWSSYNWKPKLVIVFIHNFPTSSIISDDISETND